MSNYSIKHESETSARSYHFTPIVLVAGIVGIAAQNLQTTPSYSAYTTNESSKTFGQLENIFTGEYNYATSDFEHSMAEFYTTLLEKQEPLGKEFEDVLDENRWNLYVRS